MRHWLDGLFGSSEESDEKDPTDVCDHHSVYESSRREVTSSPKTRGGDRLWVRIYDKVTLVCTDCGQSLPAMDTETDRWIATDTNEVDAVDHGGQFLLQLPWMGTRTKRYITPEEIHDSLE